MGQRYAVSGSVAFDLASASLSGTNGGIWPLVHGSATGTLATRSVTFWLRSLWAYPTASAITVGLADASVTATGPGDASSLTRRYSMMVASFANVAASQFPALAKGYAKVDFPAPGLKFETNCVAFLISGTSCTSGSVGGCGYEE